MISVIATVWNEVDSLELFLNALMAQTLPADEIVISDGGSMDGTRELLLCAAERYPRIHAILLPRSNRSVGRNAAIRAAEGDLIAMTDAGSHAAPDWLEKITAPLRADPSVCMVGGYYRALAKDPLQEAIAAATVVPPERVDPETFLPSSRSLAFRKDAWARVGGYPEWSDHNEDTIFALDLRRAGCRMAFAPDAVVSWEPSPDLRRLFRQFYRYARGDAQAGLFFAHYRKNLALPAAVAAYFLGRRHPAVRTLVGLGAGLYVGKQCLRAFRRTHSAAATALTPAVVLALDLAHLTGYVHGILDRPALRRAREGQTGA